MKDFTKLVRHHALLSSCAWHWKQSGADTGCSHDRAHVHPSARKEKPAGFSSRGFLFLVYDCRLRQQSEVVGQGGGGATGAGVPGGHVEVAATEASQVRAGVAQVQREALVRSGQADIAVIVAAGAGSGGVPGPLVAVVAADAQPVIDRVGQVKG